MTITEFEDKIQTTRDEYVLALMAALNTLEVGVDSRHADNILMDVHQRGVAFFNLVERSIDEFGLSYFELNIDTKNRKIEDALAIVDTILNHWVTVRAISTKFHLTAPTVGEYSYASLQRFIATFKPEAVTRAKTKFMSQNLPISGFDGAKHSGWKIGSPKLTFLQLIFGSIMAGVTGWISFHFNELSGIQYLFTRLFMAIGATIIVTALVEVSLEVKWAVTKALKIKALGSAGLFILIYFLNPPPPPNPGRGQTNHTTNVTNNVDNSTHIVNNIPKAQKPGPSIQKINNIDQSVHIGDVHVNVDSERSLSESDKLLIKNEIESAEARAHRKFKYFAVSPTPGSRSLKAAQDASLYLTTLV